MPAYLTNLKYDGRVKYEVTRDGKLTGRRIAVPHSLMRHSWSKGVPVVSMLEIGSFEFKMNHLMKTVDGTLMPDSWFVDLSEDVWDLSDAERKAA